MYEFPPASELGDLIGDELMQISFDPYGLQFRFERHHIASELAVEQIEPDGIVWRYECVAANATASMLHRLVGKKIIAISSSGLRLSITFDNAAMLHILSQIGPYES